MSGYRIVNIQGDVLFDEDEYHRDVAMERGKREGEPFTATVDCPDCGRADIHWLDWPRFESRDNSPVAKAMREINRSIDYMSALHGNNTRRYDPPGTVVARVCRHCGYRWGQR